MPQKRDDKAWEKINRDLRQSRSAKSLSEGGLPVEAVDRLKGIVSDKHRTFSANLSVNEFLCTRAAGYRPLGQVSGNSMFHLGWQTLPYFSSGELKVITEAQSSMRRLAVSRIQQEARLLEADGVIGVKLNNHEYDWGAGLLEFTLIGTAIRIPDQPVNPNPFVSTLSGQEFWSLYTAGFYPVGFGYGNSVYYQTATPGTRYVLGEEQFMDSAPRGTGWFNMELTDFSEAIQIARSLAEMRIQTDLVSLSAAGMIDVDFHRSIKFYEREPIGDKKRTDMSVSIEITGTGIAAMYDTKTIPTVDYGVWLT